MSDLPHKSALLEGLATAMSADLAISPMIVVGGNDPRDLLTGWTGTNRLIESACRLSDIYPLAYWLNKDGMTQLVEQAGKVNFAGDDATRYAIINMQSTEDDGILQKMLASLRSTAVRDYVVVIVVRPDQLAGARTAVEKTLGVPHTLVPTWWFDQSVDPREIRIVGHAALVGRINGYNFIAAKVFEPYPHEVELVVLTQDEDESNGYGLDTVVDKLGGDADFAASARMIDGRLTSRIEDIVVL